MSTLIKFLFLTLLFPILCYAERMDTQQSIIGVGDNTFLRLDTTNDPLTGELDLGANNLKSTGSLDDGTSTETFANIRTHPSDNTQAHSDYLRNDVNDVGKILTLDGVILGDRDTVGQAAGPLVTFDDTGDDLEITGCDVGIGTATPIASLEVSDLTNSGNVEIGRFTGDDGFVRVLNQGSTNAMRMILNNNNLITTFPVWSTAVVGDPYTRFGFAGDGKLFWGSGSVTFDTDLYRNAADQLRTSDSLIIDGRISINNTALSDMHRIVIDGSAVIGQVIKGAVSQTAPLQEYQQSNGTVLNKVDNLGDVTLCHDNPKIVLEDDAGGTIATLQLINSSGTSRRGFYDTTNDVMIWNYEPSGNNLTFGSSVIIDTDTGTDPLNITRLGLTDQTLQIWVTDKDVILLSNQDENTATYGNMKFRVDDDGTADGYFLFETKSGVDLFKIESDADIVVGSGAAGKDYTYTVNGETNDGVRTWMEDEDYFKEEDDILFNEQTGNTLQTTTLGVGVTTVAVTKNVVILTGDGGANTLATITGSLTGQMLTIIFTDGNITITDDNTHGADSVDLSAAFTGADDTILQLLYDGTSWYEISRSVN